MQRHNPLFMVALTLLHKGSFVHNEPTGVKTRQGMVHKPSKANAGESRSQLRPEDRSLSAFVVPLLLEPFFSLQHHLVLCHQGIITTLNHSQTCAYLLSKLLLYM